MSRFCKGLGCGKPLPLGVKCFHDVIKGEPAYFCPECWAERLADTVYLREPQPEFSRKKKPPHATVSKNQSEPSEWKATQHQSESNRVTVPKTTNEPSQRMVTSLLSEPECTRVPLDRNEPRRAMMPNCRSEPRNWKAPISKSEVNILDRTKRDERASIADPPERKSEPFLTIPQSKRASHQGRRKPGDRAKPSARIAPKKESESSTKTVPGTRSEPDYRISNKKSEPLIQTVPQPPSEPSSLTVPIRQSEPVHTTVSLNRSEPTGEITSTNSSESEEVTAPIRKSESSDRKNTKLANEPSPRTEAYSLSESSYLTDSENGNESDHKTVSKSTTESNVLNIPIEENDNCLANNVESRMLKVPTRANEPNSEKVPKRVSEPTRQKQSTVQSESTPETVSACQNEPSCPINTSVRIEPKETIVPRLRSAPKTNAPNHHLAARFDPDKIRDVLTDWKNKVPTDIICLRHSVNKNTFKNWKRRYKGPEGVPPMLLMGGNSAHHPEQRYTRTIKLESGFIRLDMRFDLFKISAQERKKIFTLDRPVYGGRAINLLDAICITCYKDFD